MTRNPWCAGRSGKGVLMVVRMVDAWVRGESFSAASRIGRGVGKVGGQQCQRIIVGLSRLIEQTELLVNVAEKKPVVRAATRIRLEVSGHEAHGLFATSGLVSRTGDRLQILRRLRHACE